MVVVDVVWIGGLMRRVLASCILGALAFALVLLPVSPAAAHDVLEATEPADGAAVTSVPSMVRLTFSNTPLALGSEVLVKVESGTNQAEGPVSIVDNHVSQAVKAGAPAGRYTVIWRVVSSDSHPIEGTFSFTVGQGTSSVPTTPAPKPPATAEFPWGVVAAGGAVLLGGLVVWVLYVRRRLSVNDPVEEQ